MHILISVIDTVSSYPCDVHAGLQAWSDHVLISVFWACTKGLRLSFEDKVNL